MSEVSPTQAVQEIAPSRGLHSAISLQRLEQIARLRARGIGSHIALPQLVVCGDQSAGKSSVLEGLTGIPFPRQDGLCTTFATEIILQHREGEMSVNTSIIADQSRNLEEKTKLEAFHASLPDFSSLPTVIRDAGALMGIRQPGSGVQGPAFARDVLRIEVQGPLGLHLSVVDLPGLITVPNEEQSEADVKTVHELVDEYVADSRTIILAVVQAGNDIANQPIIQKSRKFDLAGERTVGIITKPDLINQTSERRIALLAANKDTTKLKLGFFLVKNPTPNELAQGISPEERQKNEIQYFRSSPWKEQHLDPTRTGILALREFLQQLLDRHIEKELPKVREEIRVLQRQTEDELEMLGEERSDASRMRTYLTRLSMSFHRLCTSGLVGTYHEPGGSFFNVAESHRSHRLRAAVQLLNSDFADEIRTRGAKRKLMSTQQSDSDVDEEDDRSMLVSEKDMKAWVRKYSRGSELPGTSNHVLIAELFREQASPWLEIAEDHVDDVDKAIIEFVTAVLKDVVADEHVRDELNEMIVVRLRDHSRLAQAELQRLWEDEQQVPVTYNHYFTDNVQKARHQGIQDRLKKAMTQTREQDWNGKIHVSNVQYDLDRLLSGLQQRMVVNMEEQACNEALSGLNAYYKVAMKTFVDNVCRQVLERHLLRPLSSTFSPETVASMRDSDLARIAGETQSLTSKRKQLQTLRENLIASLRELRREKEVKM